METLKLPLQRRARPRGGWSPIPNPIRRHVCAALVGLNRRHIRAAARRHGRILLEPVSSVEHYFHFIFDLALPLWGIADAAPDLPGVVVRDFGIFSSHARRLFPERLEVIGAGESVDLVSAPLLGMNPRWVHVTRDDVRSFKSHVGSSMGINLEEPNNLVLLIERLPPKPSFADDSGAARRSMPNHEELAAAIASSVREPYEFRNVQLEKLPFEEQIRLFDRAALAIGQHGGGLTNCIWMRPGSRVLEFSYQVKCKSHFRMISKVLDHDHAMHRTAGPHDLIDIDFVVRQLLAGLPTAVGE